MRILLTVCLFLLSSVAAAMTLQPERVADGVYALIGPMTGRTPANLALNANFGFIVTDSGVIVIDSGATTAGAKVIEQAIQTVTRQPVRWVINTGSQDHRWLGNGYFAAKGAEIIALQRTVNTQRSLASQHQASLKRSINADMTDTRPRYAAQPIPGDGGELTLGGLKVVLHWFGDAHFPGDVSVWLPQQKILFSGDLIYVDRMLSLRPESYVTSWHQAFNNAMEHFDPAAIVPGHGEVCDEVKARRDTGAYLGWLVEKIRPAAENWEGLDATLNSYGDIEQWQYLKNYEQLHRGNVHRAYVQFENNQSGELPSP